jgi:fatty acid desaturase
MKHLLYSHAKLTPLVAVLSRAITTWIGRRLMPAIRRRMPGQKGRLISLWIMWLLGLVMQGVMIWLLAEIVHLCIGLYELWAIMARSFTGE